MIEFTASILVFLAAHVVPAASGLRGYLIGRLGRGPYVTIYSLISLATIAWVVAAALAAPYIEIWPPGRATALAPMIAMLPACVLTVSALRQPNPLSVSFRSGAADPRKAGIAALLRHPLLWAFFLWSASHLLANGDLVGIILFASLAIFSLLGMGRLERRARQRLSPAEHSAATAPTSGDIGARLRRASTGHGLFDIAAGLLVYGALLFLHEAVIGIDPLAYVH